MLVYNPSPIDKFLEIHLRVGMTPDNVVVIPSSPFEWKINAELQPKSLLVWIQLFRKPFLLDRSDYMIRKLAAFTS